MHIHAVACMTVWPGRMKGPSGRSESAHANQLHFMHVAVKAYIGSDLQ
jgi:hypothetical protein